MQSIRRIYVAGIIRSRGLMNPFAISTYGQRMGKIFEQTFA
jgi:hypothetical protein